MLMKKILIIRFSSFGDVIHALSVIGPIVTSYPKIEIHWLTKKDMAPIVSMDSRISKIIAFDKKNGFFNLIELAYKLRKENYDLIYDAHSNLRSRVVSFILRPLFFLSEMKLIRRGKERWKRILLFKFGINLFPHPYRGMISYQNPLKKIKISPIENIKLNWTVPIEIKERNEKKILARFERKEDFIVLVPSAAWEMKRWPVEYWKKIIELIDDKKIIVLGGPQDSFCQELEAVDSKRVFNLAGKLSLLESCAIIKESVFVISGDTGLLQVADIFQKDAVAIIGPTAFGFPTNKSVRVVEINLDCRPCTKDGSGVCTNIVFQKCLADISPEMVVSELYKISPDLFLRH